MTEEVEGKQQKKGEGQAPRATEDLDAVTRKWGLEAGLWKLFTSKDERGEGAEVAPKKGSQAKELLARYGGAYILTSVTLSVISFGLCYALISNGVDVPALLAKVGIQNGGTGETVGTVALAYAAHKAASPIRFPPTVALTPIVAGWFSKKGTKPDESE